MSVAAILFSFTTYLCFNGLLQVLKRLMGGVVAIVLRPQEAQCPIVRCLARELLACAVMQPIMNFASPGLASDKFC